MDRCAQVELEDKSIESSLGRLLQRRPQSRGYRAEDADAEEKEGGGGGRSKQWTQLQTDSRV
jgi:hypothetical protein